MTKEIHIKKNTWIGVRVSILLGVIIDENAIVDTVHSKVEKWLESLG